MVWCVGWAGLGWAGLGWLGWPGWAGLLCYLALCCAVLCCVEQCCVTLWVICHFRQAQLKLGISCVSIYQTNE